MRKKIEDSLIEFADPKAKQYTRPVLISVMVFVIVYALVLVYPIMVEVHPNICPSTYAVLDQTQLTTNPDIEVSCIHWIQQLDPNSETVYCNPTVTLPMPYCTQAEQSSQNSYPNCTSANPLFYLHYADCPGPSTAFGFTLGYKALLSAVVGVIVLTILRILKVTKKAVKDEVHLSFWLTIRTKVRGLVDPTYFKFNHPTLVAISIFLITYGVCFGMFAALLSECSNPFSMAAQIQLTNAGNIGDNGIVCINWIAQVNISGGEVDYCNPSVDLAYDWCDGFNDYAGSNCTGNNPLYFYSYLNCPTLIAALGQALGYASTIHIPVTLLIVFLYKKLRWIKKVKKEEPEEKQKESEEKQKESEDKQKEEEGDKLTKTPEEKEQKHGKKKLSLLEKIELKFVDYVDAHLAQYTRPIILSVITFILSMVIVIIIFGVSTSKCSYALDTSDQIQLSSPGNKFGKGINCIEWTAQIDETATVGSCIPDNTIGQIVYPYCSDSTFFNSQQQQPLCTGSNPLIFFSYKTCPSSLEAFGAAIGYRDHISLVLGFIVIILFKKIGFIKLVAKPKDRKEDYKSAPTEGLQIVTPPEGPNAEEKAQPNDVV